VKEQYMTKETAVKKLWDEYLLLLEELNHVLKELALLKRHSVSFDGVLALALLSRRRAIDDKIAQVNYKMRQFKPKEPPLTHDAMGREFPEILEVTGMTDEWND
jgi:hypothetical protein